jgi:hypothetical protein
MANSEEESAKEYLKTHKIPELFEQLASWLVYAQPNDPKAFIIEHIEKLKNRQANHLLDDPNIISMFKMLDVRGTGHISLHQYRQAMENIRAVNYNQDPIGGDINKITCDTFLRETKRALDNLNKGFSSNEMI